MKSNGRDTVKALCADLGGSRVKLAVVEGGRVAAAVVSKSFLDSTRRMVESWLGLACLMDREILVDLSSCS